MSKPEQGKTQCPACQQTYELEDQYANAAVECTSCGEGFFAVSTKETKSCPMYGEEILAVAKKCKHCGEMLRSAEEIKQEKEEALQQVTLDAERIDKVIYVLLWVFGGMFGTHNFYSHEWIKGFAKLVLFTITTTVYIAAYRYMDSFIFYGFIYLILFISCIYDLSNIPEYTPKGKELIYFPSSKMKNRKSVNKKKLQQKKN